jgi:hypothetical protein
VNILHKLSNRVEKTKRMQNVEQLEKLQRVLEELLDNPYIHLQDKVTYFPKEMERRRRLFRDRVDTSTMSLARQGLVRPIRQKITRTAAYDEVCADLKSGQMPSVELHELAGLLGVDIQKSSRRKACLKVRDMLDTLYGKNSDSFE